MKLTLLTISILFAVFANAQIKMTGTVTDASGTHLEMAYIIAKEQPSNRIADYASSNENGKYKLKLKNNTNYLITVSFIGLKTINYKLQTVEIDINKDFKLQEDNTLQEVNVVEKIPIKVDGDTITYDADSFKKGTEKKLEDVLKQLPGVEVEDDGNVKVGGKKVKKLMVEGKDFFDGNTKLANKNIPADAVDKVQVLQNHNEIDQMGNITDNSENVALNIKLKEGKKNFWFGNITAGGGLEDKYLANPKLFYYSPKYSLNIIGDLNNIGQQSFTLMDYFKFMGGFSSLSNQTGFSISSDVMSFTMQNDRAKEIDTKFGAFNFNYSLTKHWDISGFAIYAGNNINSETLNHKTYTSLAKTNIPTETVQTNNAQNSNLGLFKLSSVYKPNADHQLNYDAFMKTSESNEDISKQSSVLQNITQKREAEILSLKQNLSYYYTLNEKHVFSAKLQHSLQNDNPFYNAQLKQFRFSKLLNFDNTQSLYNINQSKKLETQKFESKIDYFYVINKKNNINLTIGNIYNQQSFSSDLFQLLDNGTQADKEKNNDIQYTVNDIHTALHYRFIKGIFVINSGVNFHLYNSKNTQKGSSQNINFHNFMPDISINIKLKQSESIYIKYALTTSFTDVNNIAEAYVISNYNSIFLGNRNLEHSLNHRASISYRNFNSYNFSNMYFNLSYSRKIKDIKSDVYFDGINMLNTRVNSSLPDENIYFSGSYDKSFVGFKWRTNASLSYSKSNNIHTLPSMIKENNESVFFVQDYGTTFKSNFKSAINFDIGYNVNLNNYKNSSFSSNFITHSPFVNLNIALFEQIIFNAKYTYSHNSGDDSQQEYSFLDADINYHPKDSKWEFIVSCSNILNTNSLVTNSGSEFYTSDYKYFIMQPYYMLMIRYNL